jgi:hypothetical protein
MHREATLAIAFGAASGLLFLSLMSGSLAAMLLVNFTQLPLFLAGLMLGPKAAAIAGATGALGALGASTFEGAVLFVVGYAAPTVLLSWQALRWRTDEAGTIWWYPPGYLIAWLVALALAAIAAGAVLTLGQPGGFEGAVRSLLAQQLNLLAGGESAHGAQMAVAMATLFPGVGAATWMVFTGANGALAHRLLVWWRKNRRPTPDMVEIGLPGWVAIALAASLAAALLAPGTFGYIGQNALPVLGLAFFMAGLAVVHAAARRLGAPAPLLGAVYALALFVSPVTIAIAALGLIEQWAGLRRRLTAGQGE